MLFKLVLPVLILYLCKDCEGTQERSAKKGLVIPSWPKHHCYDFQGFTSISWWYNYYPVQDPEYNSKWWCSYTSGAVPQGDDRAACFPEDPEAVEFIPMVYGIPGLGHQGNITHPDVDEKYQTILGFNEPNQPDQSNIPPEEAAIAWIEFQEKYPGRTLVAPATGHADTEWFDAFMDVCETLGCRFDYLATHFYTAGTAEKTMQILKDYSDRYGGRKLWFTEFAMAKEHNEDKIIQFIKDLLPMLEHADFIYRYSWFITRYYESYDDSGWFWIDPVNSLLEQDHPRLSNVGKAYNNPWHLDM